MYIYIYISGRLEHKCGSYLCTEIWIDFHSKLHKMLRLTFKMFKRLQVSSETHFAVGVMVIRKNCKICSFPPVVVVKFDDITSHRIQSSPI